ncbi:probable G-protein coupled receptor 139 [Carcharodon carcharias]|uniref:probable G-protein coupled receptor 139 n=1 Tax=Carcharodon carcharias TaxID=13397 RepID=UPI001B7E601D|nr:probable G-protein coupled receptor 139 [Carcharodon carcharias]
MVAQCNQSSPRHPVEAKLSYYIWAYKTHLIYGDELLNVLTILILFRGKCCLSKCINRYLLGMAMADLLVIITDPILRGIFPRYFPGSFMDITPVCSLNNFLVFAATTVSVWLTVVFTFDRFVAICCGKLKTKYCTPKTAAVVLATVTVLCSLECTPWYFTSEPVFIIDNVPWYCTRKSSFINSPAWAAYELFHRILSPCVPFILICILNLLTVRCILVTSRVRRGLQSLSSGENRKDPEMDQRRKAIILLFSITGSFLMLWVTQVVMTAYQRITEQYVFRATDPLYITESTAMMLQLLSTCTNTCIYAVTQAKFREEFKNLLIYPFKLLVRLLKYFSEKMDFKNEK